MVLKYPLLNVYEGLIMHNKYVQRLRLPDDNHTVPGSLISRGQPFLIFTHTDTRQVVVLKHMAGVLYTRCSGS